MVIGCQTTPRNGSNDTWITPEMRRAYCKLHDQGYAHSVESWFEGELVGGLYGVSLGNWFFGESMFSQVSDASKAALNILISQLRAWDFEWIDCQIMNPHLDSLGAINIRRAEYLDLLAQNKISTTRKYRWNLIQDVSNE